MSNEPGLIWKPNEGPQTTFLASSAYEILYGGAAGGGKSDGLLMGPLRHVHHPAFRGLLLRRTFPELQRSLIEKSRTWYPTAGGLYNESRKLWRFPSGATIEFGHLESDSDVYQYASAEFSHIGFDELTSFTERMYTFLLSRARSAAGLPVVIRSATNPGGVGHEWTFRRWRPWLDPDSPVRADSGRTMFYKIEQDGERWCAGPEPGALSRQFIGAKVTDNPHLMNGDPLYMTRLGGLDAVTRRQLRDGDWLARPLAGMVFKREWLAVDQSPPRNFDARVRYWDRAATHGGGDWTVGLLLGRHGTGVHYVLDVVRFRGRPAEVEATIMSTAQSDGVDVMVGIEEDPGSAGKFEAAHYVRQLAGFNVRTFRPTGSKLTRALPVSAQAEQGNIKLVEARWNLALLDELEGFPDAGHDDQVDALSGAFSALIAARQDPDAGWIRTNLFRRSS